MTIPTHGPLAGYVWQCAAVLAVHVFERINRPDRGRPSTVGTTKGATHV